MGGLPDDFEIFFQPNLVIDKIFFVSNSDNSEFPIVMTVEGDLKDYVKLSEYEFMLGPKGGGTGVKVLNFTLSLPERIEPGSHKIVIYGTQQVPPAEKGIVARLQVGYVFSVFYPYPGKYIQYSVKIENAKVNETIKFTIDGISRGNETIQSAKAVFYIYDSDGNLMTTLESDSKTIEPGQKVEFSSEWLAYNVKPGKHNLVAAILYDGNRTEKSMDFMIGSPTARINDIFAGPITNGTIGKITVNVASEWDELLKGMYITLDFSKGGTQYTAKSNSFDLAPFAEDNITIFWDTSNSEGPGKYSGFATLYYLNKTSNATFYAEIKEPSLFDFGGDSFVLILIVIIAILIAAPVAMLVLRKRRKGFSQKRLM